jgi:hypothetical protein
MAEKNVGPGRFFPVLLILLAGCGHLWPPEAAPEHTPTAQPSATATNTRAPTQGSPAERTAPPQPAADSGWRLVKDGLERRSITIADADSKPVEDILVLRVDPAFFAFDVAFDPAGKDLEAWFAATGAEVIVNGGYFRREGDAFAPDGLIVVSGKAIGESYGEYGGMFAVGDAGPELRWLRERPYDPREPLRAALQSFPMLIQPGGIAGFPVESDDHIPARRTVIGRDREGRILLLLAGRGLFTLRALSLYLESSDLGLEIAMNLDGGPSSGLLLADPRETVPAGTVLPVVIVVSPKTSAGADG